MRLFTLCSYLLTKESYDWWITRRKWRFKQQISEEKKSKSVGRKYLEALRSISQAHKMAVKFRKRAIWLQNDFTAKGWFHSLRNWPSAWCDRLPMALTSSFQLWFMHRLKRWITDFLSFETTYSMHQMGSSKCSKSVQQLMSTWILHVAFILAFMICFWQRTTKLKSLNSSCKRASNCFAMDSIELSLILDCFGNQITIKSTKTYTIWLETITKVLNMLIELKGNN